MSMCCGVETRTGRDDSADGRKMPMVKSSWHGNRIAVYQGDKQGGKHVFTGLCNGSVCSCWVFLQQTLNMAWLMLGPSCGNDKLQDSWLMHLMTLKERCVSNNWLWTRMDPALGKGRMDDVPPGHTAFLWMCRCSWGNLFLRRRKQNPSLFLWWCAKDPVLYLHWVIPGWFLFLLLLCVFCPQLLEQCCFRFPSVNISDVVVLSLTCCSSSGSSWAHLWGATSLFLNRSKLQFRALVCDLQK